MTTSNSMNCLYALRQVVEADDVRTCCLGPSALAPWAKHCDANGLAGTGRASRRKPRTVCRTSCIDAEVDSDVDGFIELLAVAVDLASERVSDSVKLAAVTLPSRASRVSRALP